jgi:hypothetical protein
MDHQSGTTSAASRTGLRTQRKYRRLGVLSRDRNAGIVCLGVASTIGLPGQVYQSPAVSDVDIWIIDSDDPLPDMFSALEGKRVILIGNGALNLPSEGVHAKLSKPIDILRLLAALTR